jgi:hypothetical protein
MVRVREKGLPAAIHLCRQADDQGNAVPCARLHHYGAAPTISAWTCKFSFISPEDHKLHKQIETSGPAQHMHNSNIGQQRQHSRDKAFTP